MENYIDLINAYLNKTLSQSEVIEFENDLKTDTTFASIYNEQLIILNGIERTALKEEIRNARQSYVRGKWVKTIGGLLGTLILISVVWMFIFNNENKVKDELRQSLNFENEFVQNFNVSSDSIINIVGKKGTRLIINLNDLEFESKKPLKKENLTIQLIELTNKQDLLLANAQTISNGKWLISGGAFKIDIKSENKNLQLKDGKTISVQFPKNTSKEDMQIFYGNRSENGYLNWNLTDIKLKNEKHFAIFFKDTLVLDVERTKAFGGVETMRRILEIDTLGLLTQDEITLKFPEILNFPTQKDTILIREVFIYSETDALDRNIEIISSGQLEELRVKYNDSINSYDSSALNQRIDIQNSFYEAIKISKLGWINIDKFSNAEDKVTVNIKNNLDINFNTFSDEAYSDSSSWHETYLIDYENNTILNVYSSNIDIPRDKTFTIISCCIVKDQFYVSRKVIKAIKDDILILDYKKRNKSQLKSLLRL